MTRTSRKTRRVSRGPTADDAGLLRELVAHLRRQRASLRREWARRIFEARLLAAIGHDEVVCEAGALYDKYVDVLQTGSVERLQAYARDLSRRLVHRGVETRDVLGIVLLLRDVLARSLVTKYRADAPLLTRVFDAYEPAANRIASTVAVSFVEQRERVIRRQQRAIQVLHVQEEERKRISRELHDEVGQVVVAINTYLALSQRDPPAAQDSLLKIADIETLLLAAMNRLHSFARELRPAVLDDLGLVPALRSYLKEYAERTGLLVHFERAGRSARLTGEQETALFRIAQESLSNVARHARATEVTVSLRPGKGGMQLRVRDNGQGFAVQEQQIGADRKRLGLLGMQERVRLMAGRFLVRSAPGAGTTIVAQIPLQPPRQPEALQSAS